MKDNFYISEISHKQRRKFLLISFIVFIICLGLIVVFASTIYTFIFQLDTFDSLRDIVMREINGLTLVGLFYIGFLGGLFFLPFPQEVSFFYSLIRGNSIIFSFVMVNAGYLLAQVANYFIGRKLSGPFMAVISKKKLFKARRFINKHGAKGVFLFNFLPFPAPLLTFALGITRYNIYRLFFYTLLGVFLKYILITGFYLLFY
ncbi:MAG: VTT domain-containing protein [Nanoarchaeota archaeon]|nr:VTT domain-containing protein [Nanoarchaeota archaeon]